MKNINLKSLKKAILYSQVCISMACTQMQKNDMKGGNEVDKNENLFFIITKKETFNKIRYDLELKNKEFSLFSPKDYCSFTMEYEDEFPIIIPFWHYEALKQYLKANKESFFNMVVSKDGSEEKKPVLAVEVTTYLEVKIMLKDKDIEKLKKTENETEKLYSFKKAKTKHLEIAMPHNQNEAKNTEGKNTEKKLIEQKRNAIKLDITKKAFQNNKKVDFKIMEASLTMEAGLTAEFLEEDKRFAYNIYSYLKCLPTKEEYQDIALYITFIEPMSKSYSQVWKERKL